MSLLVALSAKDGIVVASDSRGTFGDPRGITAQNDSQKKLYIVSKYAAILVAGAGELGASVMAQVTSAISDDLGASQVMETTRNVVRSAYASWFQNFAMQPGLALPVPVRPELTLLLAGYDFHNGQHEQRIYQLISQFDFAPMLHNYGFALTGIAQYALYLLNRLYEVGKGLSELETLAEYVITETATQDGKVGGPVQMAVITPEGCKEVGKEEISKMAVTNKERNQDLKETFYKKG